MADARVMDSDEDEEYLDEEAWTEEDWKPSPCTCLFCPMICESPELVFRHCDTEHRFKLTAFIRKWRLDCFGYIKLINFMRNKKPSVECITRLSCDMKPPWDCDDYMIPVDPEDPLLQYDIEEIVVEDDTQETDSPVCNNTPQPDSTVCNGSQDSVVLTQDQYNNLISRLKSAEHKLSQTEQALNQALSDMDEMKKVSRELMLSGPVDDTLQSCPTMEVEEDPYFSSYGHFSIHEEMLKDKVRTESYRDFMYKNKAMFTDKVVLDVGCGTGILSMFAARAGARHVYAVDMADIIYSAMDIVRENELGDKITFIKGKLEDISLPVDKVDIIISEWMGYFLLFESMLDSVLFARAKFLKHDGVVYPDRCNISISAISDRDLHTNHVTYWDDVYGFRMSCMKTCVVREASVMVVEHNKLVTDSCVIKDIDICGCSIDDLQFTSQFKLTVNTDGPVTAIVGYFDVFFEKFLSQKVVFSTGPAHTTTHWKQTVFLLHTPLQCKQGDILEGELSCRKNRKDTRSLIITIQIQGQLITYYME